MANFFDQFDAPAAQGASPQFRIMITPKGAPDYPGAISSIESGGNYRAIGPDTGGGNRALGKYQVMASNVGPWSQEILGRSITPEEFLSNPQIQDQIFNAKFGSYVDKYGHEGAAKAWFAGEKGMNDPNRRDILGTSVADYGRKFMNALGPSEANAAPVSQSVAPAVTRGATAGATSNFFDQFDAPATVSERFQTFAPPSDNFGELQSGLEQTAAAMTMGQMQNPVTQQATAFDNIISTAMQGTNPNIERYNGRLVSNEVFESDTGEILYRDPADGKVKRTNSASQVAIRDPRDGVVKIFDRAGDTDEGSVVGLSRVMSTGMAVGAPTARPGLAAVNVPKPGQVVANAARDLGVQVPRAVTTDSMAVQRAASGLRNVPLAGDPLVKASAKAVEQLGQKADDVARAYGSGAVVNSGDAAKGAIRTWITGTSKANATKLYDAVDNLVDNSRTVPLVNTRNAVAEIVARRANAAMGPDSKAVAQVLEAIERPNGLNYTGVKDLRTSIGELVNKGILPEGMSAGEIKKIYSALSDDLKSTIAVTGGPKASAAFQRANRYFELVSARREALAKIIGADASAPAERVFDRLVAMASSSSRADIAKLAQARKAIGAEDWNEFVSGVIAQMGRSPALRGAPEALQGTDFSPERFLTAYNKLSKDGRNMLFRSGGQGDLARALDQIAVVSGRFRELQKFANPSGTAQNVTGAGLAATAATAAISGDVVTPLSIVGSVVGGRVMANILAKPSSAAAVADFAAKYENALRVPTAPRVALLTIASRNLANTLKDSGVTVSPEQFLRAIQSPMKSAAEDEQPSVPRGPR